jgi:hypothetical protein
VIAAASLAILFASSFSPVLHATFRGEVSTGFLASFTQDESPTNRLDPLGASARAMASKAPLGGWCPHFCGARTIECTSYENAPALRIAPTPHEQLAELRGRVAHRNLTPRLQTNRPGGRTDDWMSGALSLTPAPLGGSRFTTHEAVKTENR